MPGLGNMPGQPISSNSESSKMETNQIPPALLLPSHSVPAMMNPQPVTEPEPPARARRALPIMHPSGHIFTEDELRSTPGVTADQIVEGMYDCTV